MEATGKLGLRGVLQRTSKVTITCLSLSVIALILQIVAVSTPYWLTMASTEVSMFSMKLNGGLWKTCFCIFGTCQCEIHGFAYVQLANVGAIVLLVMVVIQEANKLRNDLSSPIGPVRMVAALCAAGAFYVGIGLYAVDYEVNLDTAEVKSSMESAHLGFHFGWSFFLCIFAAALVTITMIIQLVSGCRKAPRAGQVLSVQSGDMAQIVANDHVAMQSDTHQYGYIIQ